MDLNSDADMDADINPAPAASGRAGRVHRTAADAGIDGLGSSPCPPTLQSGGCKVGRPSGAEAPSLAPFTLLAIVIMLRLRAARPRARRPQTAGPRLR